MTNNVRFYAVQLADDSSKAHSQLTASFPGVLIRPDGTETPALVIYVMTPDRARAGVFVVANTVEDDVLHGMIKTRRGAYAYYRFKFSAVCSAGLGTYDLTQAAKDGWHDSKYKKQEVARAELRTALATLLDAHPYMIAAPQRRPQPRNPAPSTTRRTKETKPVRTPPAQRELDLEQASTPVTAYVARVSFVSTAFTSVTSLNMLGKLHCDRGHAVDTLLVRYDSMHDAMTLAITTQAPTTPVRAFSGYRGSRGAIKHACVTRTQWYPITLEKFDAREGARWYQLKYAQDALVKLLQEAQAWPLIPYAITPDLVSRKIKNAEQRRQHALEQLCAKPSAARPVASVSAPIPPPAPTPVSAPVQKPLAARPAVAQAFAFCPSCGAKVLPDARFCVACGTCTSVSGAGG